LVRHRLVERHQLEQLLTDFVGERADEFLAELTARKVLTPFQAERVLAGEAAVLALGPYRLAGPSAQGAIGNLFTGFHRDQPGKTYRLRVLPLRNLWRAREAKRLLRSLSGCAHPRVVPPADADSANGYHYLVWPHTEGATLAEQVATSGPLSPGATLKLLAHLADALHACHARGVAHGALTPRSVLLDSDGLPLLLDLGAGSLLASNIADDESLLDTMCTADTASTLLEYMSPEFCAEPTPSPGADQYSLAAVGYFALTGHSPFPGLTIAAQFVAKQAGNPPLLHQVNPTIPEPPARLIDRMLRPSAAERFSGLDEVHERLLSLMGPDATRSGPFLLLEPAAVPQGPVIRTEPAHSTGSEGLTRAYGVRALPTRDDSEASIDFELPPPDTTPVPPHVTMSLAPRLARVIDTPKGLPQVDKAIPAPKLPPQPVALPTDTLPIQRSPLADGFEMAKPMPTSTPTSQKAPGSPTSTAPDFRQHRKNRPNPTGGSSASVPAPGLEPVEPQLPHVSFWKRLGRSLMFWQAPRDVIQISVFGPPEVRPGQTVKVSVNLHPPEAAESARTLARAFQHDAELVGTGFLTVEAVRGSELDVHLSASNLGVGRSALRFVWRGQPHRLMFELHIPWEAACGLTRGETEVFRKGASLGNTAFHMRVLPRRG
jgi:serine/threonine protein kinase